MITIKDFTKEEFEILKKKVEILKNINKKLRNILLKEIKKKKFNKEKKIEYLQSKL